MTFSFVKIFSQLRLYSVVVITFGFDLKLKHPNNPGSNPGTTSFLFLRLRLYRKLANKDLIDLFYVPYLLFIVY